jgi:hypothetical protein
MITPKIVLSPSKISITPLPPKPIINFLTHPKMRPPHLTYLLFPILYLHSTANLISVSNITQCSNIQDPDCTQKVSVILEIENSQDLTNSTQISANIRNLQLETGEYKTLAQQLNITLSKSKVELYYELSIPTLYNYHAHEILIDTSW